MKIVESLEESGLLIKSVTQTTENDTKKQKGRFLGVLLRILGAGFLGSILSASVIGAVRKHFKQLKLFDIPSSFN